MWGLSTARLSFVNDYPDNSKCETGMAHLFSTHHHPFMLAQHRSLGANQEVIVNMQ